MQLRTLVSSSTIATINIELERTKIVVIITVTLAIIIMMIIKLILGLHGQALVREGL